MAVVYMQRIGTHLVPVSHPDQQELLLLPERRILTIEANAKAPLKLKRYYWAMLSLLVEATGRWPTKEQAHKALLIRSGFFETVVINGNGDTRFSPVSVADWQFLEWRAYLDRLIPIIIAEYVGETPAQFRNRVDAFLGIKLKEAWET